MAIIKRTIKHIVCLVALLLPLTMRQSHAQHIRFDSDINSLHNSSLQNHNFAFDDYLQYSPAGLTVVMKACGYESMSSWPRMIVSDGLSAAIMATAVNGLKYTIRRPRPDGNKNNSFPSGHTATAFMSATILHKEYGWRSPWFSIGGYTIAAATGVSRIIRNKHWMTDIAAGAAIGIGSVHLGYYLSDLIFKKKGLSDIYEPDCFLYDPTRKHYVAELIFGHRHIIGYENMKSLGTMPLRGGLIGISTDIPIRPDIGVTARFSESSLIWEAEGTTKMYSALAGGFWKLNFARRFEFQTHLMGGYAWIPACGGKTDNGSERFAFENGSGVDLAAGVSIGLILDNNFKIKAFADFESFHLSSTAPWMNSVLLGWSSAWFW